MSKRSRNRWIVISAFLIGLAIFAAVDWWAANNDVDGDTLSEVTLYASIGRSIVGFLVGIATGVLGGHFFWPQVVTIDVSGEKEPNVEEPSDES
jgi:hypothetical protein